MLCAAAGVGALGPLGAQQPGVPTVPCVGQIIRDVVVHTSAPSVAAVLRRVPGVKHLVQTIHTTTDPEVVRRFVLLHPGDRCRELRRADSERILRSQPFIAQAEITVVPNEDATVNLEVRTSDEVALIAGIAVSAHNPPLRFLRLGDANINGQGISLAADWRSGEPFRNGFGARFVDNQLFGRPYIFTLEGHQMPLGSDWDAAMTHPYYTDIQRVAWRARAGSTDDYVQYQNDENSSHALRLTRSYFDVGGIVRVGPPGRLSLFGASISGDDERTGSTPVLVTTKGFASDSSTALLNRFTDHRIARVNALWGVRDIGYKTVRGFDAISGTQDLPIGFQLGSMFGRSLSVLGSRDDDIFMAADMYVGAVGRNNALRLQLTGEARRDNHAQMWDGILTSGRAMQYFKAFPAQTSTLTLEYSGGWRQRIPFNLSLSDPVGGVRGYGSSNTPGGQRIVARLDNRFFVGRPNDLADIALAAFADVGRIWAGDIPYGVNSPVRSSVGVSLLGAVPPGSRRIWRLDLAYAMKPEARGRRFELRVTNTDRTPFFLSEPSDIGATRERTVPVSVFRWPQ